MDVEREARGAARVSSEKAYARGPVEALENNRGPIVIRPIRVESVRHAYRLGPPSVFQGIRAAAAAAVAAAAISRVAVSIPR